MSSNCHLKIYFDIFKILCQMSGVEYITEDLSNHPVCPHGPTLLFSRIVNTDGERKRFFACSACRDRKQCSFFMWENDRKSFTEQKLKALETEHKKSLPTINHRKLFILLNKIKTTSFEQRSYCIDCSTLFLTAQSKVHNGHNIQNNITDEHLSYPSRFLKPLQNDKKEAQYLFSKSSVEIIVNILISLNIKKIFCIGAPRIHEEIINNHPDLESLLMDLDYRYHNFYGPLEYIWYNLFNHHFFHSDSKIVFEEFITNQSDGKVGIIMDPPFGGRLEPIAQTIHHIQKSYEKLNNTKQTIPVFLFFPYFMEPQILNSLPDYKMCDYKVQYDNHILFQNGEKGRKYGSPVRIFTNIPLSGITLSTTEGYKFCKPCQRWVYKQNKHCIICKNCTSKDGRTYKHCDLCEKCVKPTWTHCETCKKCSQPNHTCGELLFQQSCFHCKELGHKKRDCPKFENQPRKKRKKKNK